MPTAGAQFVEGVRNADESALFPESANGFLRRQIGGNLFADKSRQNFAAPGHDFLANDDQFRVQNLSRARARNRVVVGDDHAVNGFAAAGIH